MKSKMFESLYTYYDPPGGPSVSPFQDVSLLGTVYRPPPDVVRERNAILGDDDVSKKKAGKASPRAGEEMHLPDELQQTSERGPVGTSIALAGSATDESLSLPAQLRHRYYSIIWFTYRSKFPKIQPTNLTSDAGWGCLIRSGQMMMAQALLRKETKDCIELVDEALIRKIILLFADSTSQQAIFSIHNIAKMGSLCGCPIGKWFGPLILCSSVQKIVDVSGQPAQLAVYVATDGQINDKELVHQMERGNSIVVLIPLRLGLNGLHSVYVSGLSDLFSWPSSIGAIGGASQAARYFVGIQKDRILMLDPHTTQKAVDLTEPNFSLDSYRCLGTDSMPVAKINPSLAFGFYLHNRQSLDDFLARSAKQARSEFPLFAICDTVEVPGTIAVSASSSWSSSSLPPTAVDETPVTTGNKDHHSSRASSVESDHVDTIVSDNVTSSSSTSSSFVTKLKQVKSGKQKRASPDSSIQSSNGTASLSVKELEVDDFVDL